VSLPDRRYDGAMVCCIAAAFVFGLIVKALQTVFRRRPDSTAVHPTPVRKVDTPGDPVTPAPAEPGDRKAVDERTPVGV
jgi:hypothetical protein